MAEKAERDREQRTNGSDTSSGITIHVEDVSKEADEKGSCKDEGEEDGGLDGEEEVGMQATPATTGYAMAQMLSGTSIDRMDNMGVYTL